MTAPVKTRLSDTILGHLLELADAGALPLQETTPGSGLHRFRTRAAGWPVEIDVDTTVLELRAYHGRDVIATGPLSEHVTRELVARCASGAVPPTRGQLAPLRATVKAWRDGNARIFMKSPDVARHPDGWNKA